MTGFLTQVMFFVCRVQLWSDEVENVAQCQCHVIGAVARKRGEEKRRDEEDDDSELATGISPISSAPPSPAPHLGQPNLP